MEESARIQIMFIKKYVVCVVCIHVKVILPKKISFRTG